MECHTPLTPRLSVEALPRNLFAWFPFLWSKVLFPGPSGPIEPIRWQSLALLILLPGLLLYPCLAFPLLEPDESRYAEIPREMLEHGDLVVPLLQGEAYLDKPPLFYWLVAASYKIFGVHDWAARLPPALCVHGCILLTYLLGRRLLGETSAFRGALLLGLAPGFVSIGRLLLLDGLLTLCSTLALLSAFEAVRGERLRMGWWLLSAVACGLAILAKGPVALVLLVPPLLLYRRLSGQGCAPSWTACLAFLAIVAAVALPWYIALCVRVPDFVRHFFWEHHIVRFFSGMAHIRGFWFYAPVVLLGLFPGTLFIWPFLCYLTSGEESISRQRRPELGFLLLSAGCCILFFTLSACKLPTYVLPSFPLLALAFGHFFAHGRWSQSRLPTVTFAATFVLLLGLHHVWLPWYAGYRSPMNQPESLVRLCTDRTTPVICYPRDCDSVSFYLSRDDLKNYRSHDIEALRDLVRSQPRTVILCTHRHSLKGLKQLLPPEVRVTEEVHLGLGTIPGVSERFMGPLRTLMGETAHGLCDLAVIERIPGAVATVREKLIRPVFEEESEIEN